ncbi:MAG: polymerase, sigma-24 subunit, subfamily [Frankiales bacterium]|nr:polymerase, sigma-24 subunit, subfamily [Frankiales bacterium]
MGRDLDQRAARFDEYVATQGTRLLRSATLLVGGADAPDVVQDALVGLYKRWDRVVAAHNPDAYVHRSLVNAALQLRRRRRRVVIPITDMTAGGGHAEMVGSRQDMARALGALPPRQRTVLVLAFYEDRSEAEIAREMGCSTGTVKSQKSKALATLRKAIQNEDAKAGMR